MQYMGMCRKGPLQLHGLSTDILARGRGVWGKGAGGRRGRREDPTLGMLASFWVSLSAWRAAASALLVALALASSLTLTCLFTVASASAVHTQKRVMGGRGGIRGLRGGGGGGGALGASIQHLHLLAHRSKCLFSTKHR